MPTVLITGAARGLGLEFARQYAADGWTVHACARDPDAAALAAIGGDVHRHRLDVTSAQDAADLAAALKGTPIDILINNAGIYGQRGDDWSATDYDVWAETLAVNVLSPFRVAAALMDNVAASDKRMIANISSRMGSITEGGGGAYVYKSSKAALNAAMVNLAQDVAGKGVTILCLHPGWVQTDMGGASASLTPVESVTGVRKVLAGAGPGDSGRFLNYDGSEIPW